MVLQANGSGLVLGIFDATAELSVYPGLNSLPLAPDPNLVPSSDLVERSRPVDEVIDFLLLVDGVHPTHPDVVDSPAADVRNFALVTGGKILALGQDATKTDPRVEILPGVKASSSRTKSENSRVCR